jgi:hypothetical protein
MEARESRTFRRHLVNARHADVFSAKAAEIAVALVVGEDDNEVRLLCGTE